MYENAIGKENMSVLLRLGPAMYFGVTVVKEMEEAERQYLSKTSRLLWVRKRST